MTHRLLTALFLLVSLAGSLGAQQPQEVTPEHFGAVRGSEDCADALQAAVDSVAAKYDTPGTDKTGIVRLGVGTYTIGKTIVLRSGVRLIGSGPGTKIVKARKFDGESAFDCQGGNYAACNHLYIAGFSIHGDYVGFSDGTSTNGYPCRVGLSTFEDIEFICTDGFIFDHYCQSVSWRRILSQGEVERFFDVKGNFLVFDQITQEGGTGNNDAPIFKLSDWAIDFDDRGKPGQFVGQTSGIVIDALLIEGNGHKKKTPIVLDGVNGVSVRNVHIEVNHSDGYGIRVKNSGAVAFDGPNYYGRHKLGITNTQSVIVDMFQLTSGVIDLAGVVEVDDRSSLTINQLISWDGTNTYKAADAGRIKINNVVTRSMVTAKTQPPGLVAATSQSWTGGNALVNPSFESGERGWKIENADVTYEDAETSFGKQLRIKAKPNANPRMMQAVAFTDSQVGQPFTLAAMVKVNAEGSGNCWVSPMLVGCGISSYQTQYSPARKGGGWVMVTQTFIPQQRGQLLLGLASFGVTDFSVDNFSLTAGNVAQPDAGRFTELQLGGSTIASGPAPPKDGTWKIGDFYRNDDPEAGEHFGWVYTKSGKWKPVGKIGE